VEYTREAFLTSARFAHHRTPMRCNAVGDAKEGSCRSAQRTFQPLSFLQIHVLHIVDCVPQKHSP
jgi:hypothetical protein